MIFSRQPSDPIAAAEAELAKHRDREATLLSRLADANADVDRATKARQLALVDDDVSVLSAANAGLESAMRAERDARDRLAATTEQREHIEQELAKLKDHAARKAEVERVERLASEIEASSMELEKVLRRFIAATVPLGVVGENAASAAKNFGERILTVGMDTMRHARAYAREVEAGNHPPPPMPAESSEAA
jgi:hypothetical protein